jgi:peroxiredoxin Q/BCP
MLADAHFTPAATQASSLLGERAPDFVLQNDRGESVSLEEINARGAVVLVFYYGYWCNHCVAQLFGLDEDLAKFQSLDAQVVAVSADPVEQTAERFAQYGRFNFPVLADPDFRVATKYGAYMTLSDGETGDLLHATFLINREGNVTWVQLGEQPWIDNKSLLVLLSRRSATDGEQSPEATSASANEPESKI